MANPVSSLLVKLARKLGMAVLIAVLAWVTYSLWLFGRDEVGYAERHAQLVRSTAEQRVSVRGELEAVERGVAETKKNLDAQQLRATQAEKVLKTLNELEGSALERIFADKEQLKAHEAQIERMGAIKTEANTRSVELQREYVAGEIRRGELAARLAAVEAEEQALKGETSAVRHYLRSAWKEAGGLILTVFFVYLLGGLVAATVCYFGWAPFVSRGKPVQLPPGGTAPPVVGTSGVALEDAVWPGEVLWVRKRFLQTADDGLTRRGRLMLNWRMPLTCLLGGLSKLIELRNGRSDGERRVVFADAADHFAELAMVSVPEGGSFVLRAGFLVGIIAGLDQPPLIRRHWRFRCWPSWVTGQFGYFEIVGRCRLVVSAVSALQAETVTSSDDDAVPPRRATHVGLVGFSPQMAFKPVRSEGFWPYCRRDTALFEMEFAGSGVVLTRDPKGRGRDTLWTRVLKLAGL